MEYEDHLTPNPLKALFQDLQLFSEDFQVVNLSLLFAFQTVKFINKISDLKNVIKLFFHYIEFYLHIFFFTFTVAMFEPELLKGRILGSRIPDIL
jgi:hypothetical protein